MRFSGLLCLASALAVAFAEADFYSVRTTLEKDWSGSSDSPNKYFREYSVRFIFDKALTGASPNWISSSC
jgi:hypothetical protein